MGQQPNNFIDAFGIYGNNYQHPLLDIENSLSLGGPLVSMMSLSNVGALAVAGSVTAKSVSP